MASDLSPIARFKSRLLEEERQDAARRLADQAYWGDTGTWVRRAIVKIEQAIESVPMEAGIGFDVWSRSVKDAIERAHQVYRAEQDDPDGYGSATFHGVLRRLAALLGDS